MVFVTFKDNYADEFDVYGFSVYESEEAFLLDLYKTWLFDYLESGRSPEFEGYLELKGLDFYDCIETISAKKLETFFAGSDEYFKNDPKEFYFGTNEAISYESFEEFKDCFEVKEITKEEYETIKKFIGETYGVFPISY